ncbi:serine hydrolase [Bosea caraganae]|uniref:beta-lactamase n=1 Tax=Bosea caraganae TaxID=2763117 RepID=A0A370L0G5_9HYPH|nr:class A beta-lactamase [Bosea caraganae]RDJ20743.1 serine hydrolase [Bosea caraganae]RDJ21644.1 serine hydrolase [Bosea caraganae]
MPPRHAYAYAALGLLAATPALADWDKAKLDSEIPKIEQQSGGRLGVALIDLKDRKTWSHRGKEPFPFQSVFKLPLAVAVLQAVEAGKFKLDQSITVTRKDLSLYHSPLAKAFKGESNGYPLRDLLTRATGDSDNSAADLLLRLVGGPQALTKVLRDGGVTGISVDRYERVFQPEILGLPGYSWDQEIDTAQFYKSIEALPAAQRRKTLEASLNDSRDSATPEASIAFLDGFAAGNWLREPEHTRLIDTIITETKSGPDRIRAGLPKGAGFAHKTGLGPTADGLNHATNDIGIVTLPNGRRFAIAVYLKGATADAKAREAAHAAIARLAVTSLK